MIMQLIIFNHPISYYQIVPHFVKAVFSIIEYLIRWHPSYPSAKALSLTSPNNSSLSKSTIVLFAKNFATTVSPSSMR